jgi:hypothetical protein
MVNERPTGRLEHLRELNRLVGDRVKVGEQVKIVEE